MTLPLAADGRLLARPEKSDQLGPINEGRALQALVRPDWRPPPWLSLVRPATKDEDRFQQTDIVVMTADEDVFRLQIKSSVGSLRRFERRRRRRDVICIVILDTDTWEAMRRNVIAEIEKRREERKKRRRKTLANRARRARRDKLMSITARR